jgi:phosphotransferase system HPr-like phosphotransfer protein
MTVTQLEEALYQLREHAARLINDVELAATREEHIRLTARANEAETLVNQLEKILLSHYAA